MYEKIFSESLVENDNKILLIILDGLGDIGDSRGTPLELARTPNLDELVQSSGTGLHYPVAPGVTPGSGPAHLGIFGYDPVENLIGRGILEAVGIGFNITPKDVAIRGNFCTVKRPGGKLIVLDRRAGRIPTEENKRLIGKLTENIKKIEDVEIIFKSVKEHRFVVILRFPEKVDADFAKVTENDPQRENAEILAIEAVSEKAKKTERIANLLLERIEQALKEERANYALLRGFSTLPDLTPFPEKFKLKAGAIAVYPMYRGLASLVGMKLIDFEGDGIDDEVKTLKENAKNYDFFFVHIKKTDSFGEDGSLEGKVEVIESFDSFLPDILSSGFNVVAITGDHSTPAVMKSHSWHPVPLLIHSPYVLGRVSKRFTERECLKGELGMLRSVEIMPLLLAHSLKFKKFGA